MKASTKAWIIIATVSILIGIIIFGVVMAILKWDFSKLSTGKYQTNTHTVTDEFNNIKIESDTANVYILPSEDGNCSVVCYERAKQIHSVNVNDGTLTVSVNDTRNWYEHIGINFGAPKITLYLPFDEYADLYVKTDTGSTYLPSDFTFSSVHAVTNTGKINCKSNVTGDVDLKASTGEINVESMSSASLKIKVSTGNVNVTDTIVSGDISISVSTGETELENVRCTNISSDGNTGDISLESVIADNKITVERTTGDVEFDGCDASEISVRTDTGSVTGTLLTEKVFIAKTDTGRVNVPHTSSGGRCEITTDTGNIRIEIK